MCNDTMIYKQDANNLQQKHKEKKLSLVAKKIYKLLKQILSKCSHYFLDLFSCSLYSTAYNLVESNKKSKLKVLRKNALPRDLKKVLEGVFPGCDITNVSQRVQFDDYNCGQWMVESSTWNCW